jgi:hypothetical protein
MQAAMVNPRTPPMVTFARLLFASCVVASCGTDVDLRGRPESVRATREALATPYDWMQYNGDARHAGNNTLETQITAQNVAGLTKLFQVSLPSTADSSPAVLTQVTTASGVRDLLFVTTTDGHILGLDAHTGATIWSLQHAGHGPTMASPAVDPSRNFVYTYGLEGNVHKHNVGDGTEVTGGGWPELVTLKPTVEKGGGSLAIASAGGANYLYVVNGGYFGDGGDYQGHVTTINLGTGAQNVFNADCSNQTVHFSSSPDCGQRQSAVWAREGVMYDSDTGRIYFGTGNGPFAPTSSDWGDTILALNPDGTGSNGGPLDSYTPTNFQTLQNNDLDLGSSGPVILPATTKYPHLVVDVGKDQTIRIVNLDNMSGKGSPGNVAGEIYSRSLPQGGEVQNSVAVWTNPSDDSTWVFIVSPSNGIAGLELAVDAGGNPSLTAVWQIGGSGGSPLVANNVLYYATNNNLHALSPTTGVQLFEGALPNGIHWQEPVVANGVVYIADNGGKLTAFGLAGAPDAGAPDSGSESGASDAGSSDGGSSEAALSRTGWVASASNTGGGDVPANALDGNLATRWSTGTPMVNGMWFEVDMQAAQTFNELTMNSAGSTNDFARGYQVFVSSDGANFGSAVAAGAGTSALVTVTFPTQTARYVKVVQTGAASNWWSIAEFNVYTAGAAPPPPPPPSDAGAAAFQINSGGPAVAPFAADEDFAGGTTIDHANSIDLSGVTNPAPVAVYQTARIGNFSYTLGGFVPGSMHTIRLHFAETYFTTSGSRTFGVTINGTQVLSAFDIFATAGAQNKAVVEQFSENASSGGAYVVQFTSVVNNSLLSGLEVQ